MGTILSARKSHEFSSNFENEAGLLLQTRDEEMKINSTCFAIFDF